MIEGFVHPDFWPVARALGRQIRRTGGGAAVCVYFRGEPVVDAWAGVRDEAGRPWESDTMAMSFSTTKGVTATALHVLVDRGLLDYEDPVSRHWPEFAQAGKEQIRVRHLLSHQAGLHHIRRMIDHAERMLDWEHMVRALERASPALEPGSASAYHGLTFGWLIGELIQRVTGRPFADVLRSVLAEPLGLDGLHIGASRDAQTRAAQLLRRSRERAGPRRFRSIGRAVRQVNRFLGIPFDPAVAADALMPVGAESVFWHPRILDVPIPAANGLFTARSLARLYGALACGGALNGRRVLSAETLDRATRIQSRRLDRVIPVRMMWRLGYHRAMTSRGDLRAGFGHFGYGGSGAWADPRRKLAIAMVNNRVAGSPFGDLRMLSLGAAAVRSADDARSGES